MLYAWFVLGAIIFVFFLLFYLATYMVSLVYATLMGSPYLKTSHKTFKHILDEAGLQQGHLFIDLGCGEGSLVFTAAQDYGARAIGVDINPLFIVRAKLMNFFKKVSTVEFRVENILKTDVSQADVIYMFLLPKIVNKMRPRLEKEMKKGAIVISHAFIIEGWEPHLVKKISQKPFSTYIYKLS